MDAAQLAQRLASDAPGDRAAAYAALEATDDVALAVACVAPLVALFERPAAVIGASELQRASLTLGHLVSLDCLAVGGEWFRDGKWLVLWISECNALNTILNKPTVELTVADALVCAAVESPLAAALLKGEGCYLLIFVQLFEKYGTLIERNATLIEKVSPCRHRPDGRGGCYRKGLHGEADGVCVSPRSGEEHR
eukprot:SAG31_NODE_303_length_18065_cov_5.733107_13_plen_195_part_00